MRHGATEHNLRGLRCGGDLDIPLCDAGREQARRAALAMRADGMTVRLIISSALDRTRETAAIVASVLGEPPIEIEPLLNERHLGEWNARPAAETGLPMLVQALPPGAEAESVFAARIEQALARILPRLEEGRVLVVGSKGVARILNQLLGNGRAQEMANAEVAWFTLEPLFAPGESGRTQGGS
jgi:probable phosphoglycerate mutase